MLRLNTLKLLEKKICDCERKIYVATIKNDQTEKARLVMRKIQIEETLEQLKHTLAIIKQEAI